MSPLRNWSSFLLRQTAASPLVFVGGMRHTVDRGVCCAVHSHPAFEIVYHAAGDGVTRLDKRHAVPFREGSVVIYAPDQPHDQVMERRGEDVCVQVAAPKSCHLPHGNCLYVPHVANSAVREDLYLLSRGYFDLSATEQAIFNLRATALLLDLIRIASESGQRDREDAAEQHVLKAEEYIREHFSSVASLSEVACHAGVGHDYLRHIFKARRGKTLIHYLGEVRVDRAKALLRHSPLPMKQIASMCGFKDEYYFSAVFRRHAGVTPGAHRHGHK